MHRASRQLGVRAFPRHSEKLPSPFIDENGIRHLQFVQLRGDLVERENRFIRVERQNLYRIRLMRLRVLPQRGYPLTVNGGGGGDPAHRGGGIKIAPGKRVFMTEEQLGRTDQYDIGVETADQLQRAFEEGVLKTKLNQHQQDGESNARDGAHQPGRIVHHIVPRQRGGAVAKARPPRGRTGLPRDGADFGDHDQNRSTGSARRKALSAKSAEPTDITATRTRTPPARVPVISIGIGVIWRTIA
jgi:hypothetical protein